MRLITIEERERHKRIDGYIKKVNVVLGVLLLIICIILLYGWIFV